MTKVKPCRSCPFRTDINFYLATERREEIVNTLLNDKVFICHKQLKIPVDKRRPCVGSAMLLEKEQGVFSNVAYRLHILFNNFPGSYLDTVPVFNSFKEFIAGNKNKVDNKRLK